MHFQVKMSESGGIHIFKEKEITNKLPLMFLDVKVFPEKQQLRFWTLPTNNQGVVYVFRI